MSRKILKFLIALVLIAVANVGIFLLGSNFITSFWISYAFSMIAAFLTIYVEIFYASKEKLIFRYPISAVTYIYLVAQLVIAYILTTFFGFWTLRVFMIQLCVLAAYVVILLSVLIHNKATQEQQEIRGKDIMNFKYILGLMNTVSSKMPYSDKSRKIVQHAYDSLASGQVRSDACVYEQEQQILKQIELLDTAIINNNEEEILSCCKEIERAALERKTRLSQRTPF